jgi:mitochondrial import inner membrane translocase subunit TIM10
MSFLFGGKPQLSSAEKIAAAETEVEMISDMFNRYEHEVQACPAKKSSFIHRLNQSCTKKCIPADYREGDLNKGESVCLDRCVAKFFEVNIKVSEKMQGEAAGRQAGGGGMFGM